jgi:hypothetical protein
MDPVSPKQRAILDHNARVDEAAESRHRELLDATCDILPGLGPAWGGGSEEDWLVAFASPCRSRASLSPR